MRSRYGTAGKGREHACLGLPDAFALEQEQGNHPPSPGAKLRQEEGLRGPVQGRRECGDVMRNFHYRRCSLAHKIHMCSIEKNKTSNNEVLVYHFSMDLYKQYFRLE